MASTKDMALLPREVLVAGEAIRLGGGGQYQKLAARSARPLSRLRGRVGVGVPPRATASEIKRGWHNTRESEESDSRRVPHPPRFARHPKSELRSSRPR